MFHRIKWPSTTLVFFIAGVGALAAPNALAAQEGEGCMACKTTDVGLGQFQHKFGLGSEVMYCDLQTEHEAEERLEASSVTSGPSAGRADISAHVTTDPGCHQLDWEGGGCWEHTVCPPGGDAAFSASIDELAANLRKGSDAAALSLLHEVNAVNALSLDAQRGVLTLRSCDGSEVRSTWVVDRTSLATPQA